MRVLVTAALLLTLSSIGACSAVNVEDTAYDLVKAKARQDLSCDDVTIKKMAQAGEAFEYQAAGCSDLYSYGVDCEDKCTIVAGVRGPGLGGLWNKSTSMVDQVFGMILDGKAEMDKEQAEAKARHEAFRREIDEQHTRNAELVDRARARQQP